MPESISGDMTGLVKTTEGSPMGWTHNAEDKVSVQLGKGGVILNPKSCLFLGVESEPQPCTSETNRLWLRMKVAFTSWRTSQSNWAPKVSRRWLVVSEDRSKDAPVQVPPVEGWTVMRLIHVRKSLSSPEHLKITPENLQVRLDPLSVKNLHEPLSAGSSPNFRIIN